MQAIQMVDLKNQYVKIRHEIDDAISSVLDSTAFIKGPEVRLFEQELAGYLGVKHVIACGNGTDALQVTMMAKGLKPGDEVITTDFTFVSTVEVIALLGLKLVIVDTEPDTFNISADAIRKAVTPRTKAIVPVHLFGQCSNMDEILKIAKEYDLLVIEDAAQATGADFIFSNGAKAKAGTLGDAGCTSFFPSKNLGCFGDGGAIFTNNDETAELLRSITNHGMRVRYYHDMIGVNSRLDTIQAAVLRVKLRYLDRFNNARRAAADVYDNALSTIPGIVTPVRSSFSSHIFHQYTLRIKNGLRDSLKDHLQSLNIPCMIYYPVPVHKQKAYSRLDGGDQGFPVTTALCSEVLSLPMHTELDAEQMNYIISGVINFFEKI